jgi:hypothetical protein
MGKIRISPKFIHGRIKTRSVTIVAPGAHVGSSVFSPLQLPSLKIWIEVDLSCAGLNNNDLITAATDLSGLGNHMSQSVAGNKLTYLTNVLNGFPVARFLHADASDGHWMTSAYSPSDDLATSVTLAAVVQTENSADSEIAVWVGDANGNGFGTEDEIHIGLGDLGGGNLMCASYGGSSQGPESAFSPFNDNAGYHTLIGTFNNMTNDGATKNAILYFDGVAQTTGSGTTSNNYATYQGQTWWGKPSSVGVPITRVWNGRHAAMLVCGTAISAAQALQLHNFWKAKYGL